MKGGDWKERPTEKYDRKKKRKELNNDRKEEKSSHDWTMKAKIQKAKKVQNKRRKKWLFSKEKLVLKVKLKNALY